MFFRGEVLEWLKRHAWKACMRCPRIEGSNPSLSASNNDLTLNKSLNLVGYAKIISAATCT